SAQRLQFVVQFAEMDLDVLQPGEWLTLRDDLAVFLRVPWHSWSWGRDRIKMQPGPILVFPTEADYPDTMVWALQQDVRTIVYGMVQANRDGVADPHVAVPLRVDLAIDNWGTPEMERHPALVAAGATRDVFLLLTFMLLREVGTHQILRCPEC